MMLVTSPFFYSQSLKAGFRIEPGIFLSEEKDEVKVIPVFYSVSADVIYYPLQWIGIEVRPGYMLVSEDYGGYNFGIYARLQSIIPKIFFVAGINKQSNFMNSAHNSGGSYTKDVIYKGIGIGYQCDSKLSFDIMYYWTNDKDYAYCHETDWLTYSHKINKSINGIMKIGFNLNWDVLK